MPDIRFVDKNGREITLTSEEMAEQAANTAARLASVPARLAEYDERLVGHHAILRGLESSVARERGLNGRLVHLVAWRADLGRFVANLDEAAESRTPPRRVEISVHPRNLDVVAQQGDLVIVKTSGRSGTMGGMIHALAAGDTPQLMSTALLTLELLANASCIVFTDCGTLTVPCADVEVRSPCCVDIPKPRILSAEEALAYRLSDRRGNVMLLGDPNLSIAVQQSQGSKVHQTDISRELEDPRTHALPSDPALRVAPPLPLPATTHRWSPPPICAGSFDVSEGWTEGWSGCVLDMRPSSLAMARGEAFPLPPPTVTEREALARRQLNQVSGLERIPAGAGTTLTLGPLLGHVLLSVSGEQPFRFIDLNADSVEHLPHSMTTLVQQAPEMRFVSERDNWALTVRLYKLDFAERERRMDTATAEQLLPLKAYDALLAAVDARYLPAVLLLLDAARNAARTRKLLKPLADALQCVAPAVRALTHATAPFDAARLEMMRGELLEEDAGRAGQGSQRRALLFLEAIRAYQNAVEFVKGAPPSCVPSSMWVAAHAALGLALKRYATFDRACFGMAERSYRWGLSCPRPREDVPLYLYAVKSLLYNVLTLMEESNSLSTRELAAVNKARMRSSASVPAAAPRTCATCAKLLGPGEGKACSACRVVFYCGKDCQKAHWTQHKRACRFVCGAADE